jgi:DNA-binding response OmpR family regulator
MITLERLRNVARDLKVLYVEDDLVLQNKTKSIFKNIFNSIDTANDGEEAFLKYEAFKYEKNATYDLVITDIKMPNLNGNDLVRRILSQNKEQKIIVTSAYSDKNDLISFINLGISRFIQKPFTAKQIIDLLLDVIGNDIEDGSHNEVILSDNLVWNKLFKELRHYGSVIKLSHNETKIIDVLTQNPQQIFGNDELFYLLDEENQSKSVSIDSIKSIVKRLRQKLPSNIIENIYGHGYKLLLKTPN